MSYEGYSELLCENGHYEAHDVHAVEGPAKNCTCGAKWKWYHSVDQTNGVEYLDAARTKVNPATVEAETVEIGWDDVRNEDHYGTVYFTKWVKYQPAPGSAWQLIEESNT